MKANEVIKKLYAKSSESRAVNSARFFKTGKGQYGEGDKFIGVTVPDQRIVAKAFIDLSLIELKKLLESGIHEHRFTALIILVYKYQVSDKKTKNAIFDFYLKNTSRINNWDLVDCSCRDIVGEHLQQKDRKILYKLSKSHSLWERRIAIVSTWAFIRKGDLKDTFAISKSLFKDKHDLIHKAVGWMLREAGKKDEKELRSFLNLYANKMPRTALRYAIERMPETTRKMYLKKS